MTLAEQNKRKKLQLIHTIIEGRKEKLEKLPSLKWYGDTFDELYDIPTESLANRVRIKNWLNSK